MAPLAITPGDPLGVGPEVVCMALRDRAEAGHPVNAVVFGDAVALHRAAEWVGFDGRGVVVVDTAEQTEPAEVVAIRGAVDAIRVGRCSALVTGPIHKARLAARGFGFPGHTDFLGHLCGVDRPVMAFVGGEVRVALVTVHMPLRAVPDALTVDAIVYTANQAHLALRDQLGLSRQRLAICGLNPHAGDNGLLGHEDADVVAPAVAQLQALGVDAFGPVSAEHAFVAARRGEADMVVAMYHDQGLAPLKALDFGRSVNWTLGLPLIRTSVDHGTADDLAGTGRADPGSMLAALALAEKLAGA